VLSPGFPLRGHIPAQIPAATQFNFAIAGNPKPTNSVNELLPARFIVLTAIEGQKPAGMDQTIIGTLRTAKEFPASNTHTVSLVANRFLKGNVVAVCKSYLQITVQIKLRRSDR